MLDFLFKNGTWVLVMILGIILLVIIMSGYVKAPPDKAYIISGLRKKAKVVIGKASIKIPFLERKDELELSLVQVDVKTESSVPTKEFINVRVDGVANVKVSSAPESMAKAAENFLNKDKQYIASIVQQVLEGNMREIIGQMELTELVHNRDVFALKVQESTALELEAMGLSVVNLTIQNFIDDNNVIENLGIDNVTKIQKDAAIARANSERDIKIAQSKANSESNDAEVKAQTAIAITQNELAIKRADLKAHADTEQARSDAAYSIAEQTARKEIEIETVNAEIARTEREAEKKKKEIEVAESSLRAEAKAFEIEREALAEKKRAEAILEVGLAEAEVIEKKALAQNNLNQASLSYKLIEQLPEIVRGAAEPLAKTEKIVMFGEGNAERLMKDTLNSSLGFVEGLKEGTGVDLPAILNTFAGTKLALQTETSEISVTEEAEAKTIVKKPKRGPKS